MAPNKQTSIPGAERVRVRLTAQEFLLLKRVMEKLGLTANDVFRMGLRLVGDRNKLTA